VPGADGELAHPSGELVPRLVQPADPRVEELHEAALHGGGLEAAQEEAGPVQARAHRGRELAGELGHLAGQGLAALGDELGGGAGRGRAQVGGEVGEGPVYLVADGADHGDPGGGDGAHDGLVGEGEEVLQGAAAAAHDEDVAQVVAVGPLDLRGDLARRGLALDGRGQDAEREPGVAPP